MSTNLLVRTGSWTRADVQALVSIYDHEQPFTSDELSYEREALQQVTNLLNDHRGTSFTPVQVHRKIVNLRKNGHLPRKRFR